MVTWPDEAEPFRMICLLRNVPGWQTGYAA